MLPLLPNWFYAQLPRGWWPRPREFYCYQLNVIPFSTAFGAIFQKEIVFSKRSDAIVFGGHGLITTVPAVGIQMSDVTPASGASVGLAVSLSNPSAQIQYTPAIVISPTGGQVGGVPWESLFSQWGYAGFGSVQNNPAQLPCFWPIPITVQKGGSLLISFTSIRNPLPSNLWVRLTFWCCLLYDEAEIREAA